MSAFIALLCILWILVSFLWFVSCGKEHCNSAGDNCTSACTSGERLALVVFMTLTALEFLLALFAVLVYWMARSESYV